MRGYGEVTRRIRTRDYRASDVITAGILAQAVIDEEFDGVDRWTPLHRDALLGRFENAPEFVTVKVPEGYAFYAVYPELYAIAARTLPPGLTRRVIGIRAIGTSLGRVVADAVHAQSFVTVRPVGHPFQRELRVDESMRAEILKPADEWLIVDEGPGLSGSSFGCVADFLEANGVRREQIVFFPSHPNDLGPEASAEHRQRWRTARKAYCDFESLLPQILAAAEPLIGRVEHSVDIGAGGWRRFVPGGDNAPSSITRERRKYLVNNRYLFKFGGLGGVIEPKIAKAKQFSDEGLTPPFIGAVNGFMIYEWVKGRLVDLERDDLDSVVRRYVREGHTDNRMHRWEWIVTDRGILKCDAVDHEYAHDGVGPQPLSWDLAGAVVELGLSFDVDTRAYLEEQIARCEQFMSEGLDPLWRREYRRYVHHKGAEGKP